MMPKCAVTLLKATLENSIISLVSNEFEMLSVFVRCQLVSVTGDSSVVSIWNITKAVTSRTSVAPADCLTSPINDVILTSDDKLAFVSAIGSDEVGVFEMSGGQLVDLMTHEGPVAAFSITYNGAFMCVGLQHARPGQFNKVSFIDRFHLSTCAALCCALR